MMSKGSVDQQRVGTRREAQEVAYEFFALRGCMDAWRSAIEASRPMLPEKWYPSGMYVESWFLHARNVVDFLYPDKNNLRPNSLVAWFFVSDWETVRPFMADGTFDRLRTYVNKMVAHLTSDRAIEGRMRLEVQEVYEYAKVLDGLIDSFLRSLPLSRVEWFELKLLWFEGVPTDFRANDPDG